MTLEKILRGAVLTGIFAMPFIVLIVAQSLFFPFITGKNFTFRVIVEIIAALWLALALVNPEYRPRRSWIIGAFAFFVLMIGISDFFGANPFKSFWSNYERMEGWITLAHLLMYLIVVVSALSTETLWRRFWHTSIGVSILVGFYGIFQLFGWITINQGGVRLDATFGNAIYLAIYMLFHLFITALVWENAWRTSDKRLRFSVAYGLIMTLQAFILFFTASRGAILGLLGGALLSAILLVILANQSKNAWRATVGVVLGILLLSGGFYLIRGAAWVQRIEPLTRLASISFTENTVASRFLNIGMAVKGIKERPIFGWGQENYNLVFNKYYDPRMYMQEQWFDRTHNIVFDWLIAGGIAGFLAYVLIYLAAFFGLWRSGAFTVPERSILTGLLVAYAFSIFFVFDNITSYFMFMLMLAYLAFRSSEALGRERIMAAWTLPRSWAPVVAAFMILVGAGTVWAVNWKPLVANYTLLQALKPHAADEGGLQKNIETFAQAIAYNTFGTQEMREQLIQGTINSVLSPSLSNEDKQKLFTFGASEMEKQIAAAPDDARFPFFLGALFATAGQHDKAKTYLERALALSPTKQTIRLQLVMNEYAAGNRARAIELAKETFELAPEFNDPRIIYAALLIAEGDNARADEVIRPLIERGEAADQRLIGAYAEHKRYDKIAEIWAARVRLLPADPQARFALAATHYAMGNRQKAIEVLEQAAKEVPVIAPQAQQLIQQIKNGTIKLQK